MEKQQDPSIPMLCRAGCGFFGHQAFENYCSKCYPSHQRQMQAQQQAMASSGPVANSASFSTSSSSASLTSSSSSHNNFAPSTTTSLSASQNTTETATSTIAASSATFSSTSEPLSIPAPASSSSLSDAALFGSSLGTSPADELNPAVASPTGSATKAPRRCGICNKRTGLTGFECRGCSGWHCTEHRYPDKHSCSFDYKTADRDRLRRENPAVVGEKIQKI